MTFIEREGSACLAPPWRQDQEKKKKTKLIACEGAAFGDTRRRYPW